MDKKWESRLIPVWSEAVVFASNLLTPESSFLDKLVQKKLLTRDQTQVISIEREKSEKEAARRLFTVLQRRSAPSFDMFCDVLTEVDQGQDLRNLLTKGLCQSDRMHRSGVSNVSQAAGRRVKEASSIQPFSETDSGAGHDGAKMPTILQVLVLEKYRDVYKTHKRSVQSTIKVMFLKMYPHRQVELVETFTDELRRSSEFGISIPEMVAFRIIFPRKNRQDFEPYRECIVWELATSMGIPEDQLDIRAFDGSCILLITIPGDGFIRFVAALGVPGRLDFLYAVDAEVIVKIDGLFEIPLKTLHGTQDEEVLKFPNGDDDSQHFPKENPVLSDEGWSSGNDSCEAPYGTTEGDPNWKRLSRVQSAAVDYCSNLLGPGSHLLNKLIEKECITDDQMEEIDRRRHAHGTKEAAQKLFEILKKRRIPYFHVFGGVLQNVEQGQELRDLLMTEKPELRSTDNLTYTDFLGSTQISTLLKANVTEEEFEDISSKVHKKRELILEQMQTFELFTANEVERILQGKNFFTLILTRIEEMKTAFVTALSVIEPNLLRKYFTTCRSELLASEYVRIGGTCVRQDRPTQELMKNIAREKGKNRSIDVVLVGATGIGKSSLINSLIGHEVAPVGHFSESVTCKYQPYAEDMTWTSDGSFCSIKLWDSPGFIADLSICECETMAKEIKGLDLLIFCLDCLNPRLNVFKPTIHLLTEAFGKGIWKHSIFALTKANWVRSPTHDSSDEEQLKNTLVSVKNGVQELMEKETGELDTARSIPVVPVGRMHTGNLLPDGRPWRPHFWAEAAKVRSKTEGFVLDVKIGLKSHYGGSKSDLTKLDTFLAILPEVQGGKALLRVLGATTSEAPSEEKETPSIASRRQKEASSMQGLYQSDRSDTAVDSLSSLGSIIAAKVVRQLAPHHSDVSSDTGRMADPKWEEYLTPVRSSAVKLAADLLGSDSLFLDELVEKKCLTNSQLKNIRRLRREQGSIDAASELFDEMKEQPFPSFDTFCAFLLDVTSRDASQGKDLYNLLVKPSQLDSSMTSGAAERQEEPNDAAAVQSRPKNVSDKAAISKIASSVSSTFIPAAEKDSSVLVSLGNLSEQILEVMQQSVDSKFTVAQVTLITRNWKWSERQRKGLAVLECLTEANEEVKASFAFALFAVDASVLAKVSPDVYEKVSRSSVKEYLKVGVAWIGNDAFRNALKKNLGSIAGKKKEFNIVLLGKAGVGKSTLINALVGQRKVAVSASPPCTPFAGAYHVICSQDVPIDPVIWDTPGLFDTYLTDNEYTTQTRDSEYLKEIAKQVKEVDLVIFCADATNPRYTSEVSRSISSVTNAFSKKIWQHIMFVFTKANMVRAHEDDVDAHLQKIIAALTDSYRKLLLHLEINQEVIDFIPFVPVGSARDKILANGKPWIPEFWVTAVERATDAGCRFPLMFNEKQLQFAENQLQSAESSLTVQLSEEHVKRSVRSNASGGTIVTKVFNWFKRGP